MKKFKPDDRVKTPDGLGIVFECSMLLPFVSVFLDGERKARIYGKDEVKKIK